MNLKNKLKISMFNFSINDVHFAEMIAGIINDDISMAMYHVNNLRL